MYCPACGTELDGTANYCRDCGEQLTARHADDPSQVDDPRAGDDPPHGDPPPETPPTATQTARRDTPPEGPPSGQATDASRPIPAGAAAVDITCQHCGVRPIEELATGHRITGMVLVWFKQTYQLIGCHRCVRRKLWWMAAKNLVVGWWAYPAGLWNAALTAKNIGRGAVRRGPNRRLIDALDAVGVTYDYLDDPAAFDPSRHSPMELYIRGFVRLGTAVMLADDEAHPNERRAIRTAILELEPGYPPTKVNALIERASQTTPDVERVAEGLSELLSPAGEHLLVEFVAAVAEAGVTDQAEIELVATITRALDMDEHDVDAILADRHAAPPPTA